MIDKFAHHFKFAVMKKLFFLTLLFLEGILVFSQGKQNYLIRFGETQVLISNNFLIPENSNSKKNVQQVKAPWKDQVLNVYGKQLSITVSNGLMTNVPISLIMGNTTKHSQYNFEKLEFQIFKNNKILYSWRNINAGFTIDEKTISSQKTKELKGYKIFDQILTKNDVVKISFRTKGGKPFLNCTLNKVEDDKVPFVCSGLHNYNGVSLETFVEEALAAKKQLRYSFYEDWPSSYFAKYRDPIMKVDEKTKIAIFYRPKNSANTKDMLEYRLLENGTPTSETWKKANDFIILHDFKPGKKYVLQVKYRGEKEYITKEFFSEPKWFQNVWLRITFVIFFLALLGFIILVLRNRRIRRLQKEQKAKLQFMSAQLNPHFIFNALNSIQGLVNAGNTEKSNLYLTEFSKLMRSILDFSDKELIPISLEIKALKNYISLEQFRFSFHFDFMIDEEIQIDEIEVLPMLVQPIIENSIKHGISVLGDKGQLSFKILKKGRDLVYEIKDNGNGFKVESKFKGKGLMLTKERMLLFNSASKHIKIEYFVESNNNGTQTLITYKNLLEND